MVSMLFKSETNLVVMIERLRIVKEEFQKVLLQNQREGGSIEFISKSSTETCEKSSCYVLEGLDRSERG